jgi:hypothetical protein
MVDVSDNWYSLLPGGAIRNHLFPDLDPTCLVWLVQEEDGETDGKEGKEGKGGKGGKINLV